MFRIGLLSDTHGYFDPRIASLFSEVDEIWHAGDVGDYAVILELNHDCPGHCGIRKH